MPSTKQSNEARQREQDRYTAITAAVTAIQAAPAAQRPSTVLAAAAMDKILLNEAIVREGGAPLT